MVYIRRLGARQVVDRANVDRAKFAQLLPVVGAGVGVVVNYRLIDKLGKTAMNDERVQNEVVRLTAEPARSFCPLRSPDASGSNAPESAHPPRSRSNK